MVNAKRNFGTGWNRCTLFFLVLGLLSFTTGTRAAVYQEGSQETVTSGEKGKITVEGMVVDENGRPLDGVCISTKNSNTRWFTGRDGKFSFVVDKGAKLMFFYAGKLDKTIRAKVKKEMRVVLVREEVEERMPLFSGGDLQQYIARNVKYPKDAIDLRIEGKVFVQFIIEKDGSISNIRAIRPVFYSLDAEACRVVREMPRWKPGIQKGKPVRVSYTVPINFKLQ